MRFLFLTIIYPQANLGGWEQWYQAISAAFRERGHEVTILTRLSSESKVQILKRGRSED